MAANVKPMTTDRCDICGYRFDGTFADRREHLRRSHPRYARALLLRLSAPFVFLVGVLVCSALGAPQNAYLVALALSFGALFFGKQLSRLERRRAGARATLPVGRLLREGGVQFLLLIPLLGLLVYFLGKR